MTELEKTIDHLTQRNGFVAGALWMARIVGTRSATDAATAGFIGDMLERIDREADQYADGEAAKLTSDKVIDGLARDIAAYPDHRAQVDTGRLIAQHTQRAVNKVMGAMGLAYLLDEATPPSIAAHPDAILHSDDTPPPTGGAV